MDVERSLQVFDEQTEYLLKVIGPEEMDHVLEILGGGYSRAIALRDIVNVLQGQLKKRDERILEIGTELKGTIEQVAKQNKLILRFRAFLQMLSSQATDFMAETEDQTEETDVEEVDV